MEVGSESLQQVMNNGINLDASRDILHAVDSVPEITGISSDMLKLGLVVFGHLRWNLSIIAGLISRWLAIRLPILALRSISRLLCGCFWS